MPFHFTCEICGKPFTRPQRTKNGGRTPRFCSKPCQHLGHRIDPLERFWRNVHIESGENPCWIWRAVKRTDYGTMSVNGKVIYMHRFAWETFKGKIPEGLDVCHNCPGGDNRSCVNPDHMFLGTHQENIIDCVQKGHKVTKLTVDSVRQIRELAEGGAKPTDLAKTYGVRSSTIHKVIRRERWTHI